MNSAENSYQQINDIVLTHELDSMQSHEITTKLGEKQIINFKTMDNHRDKEDKQLYAIFSGLF